MMGKKNLEQLFKESFQDFQEVPDEKVWNSIEASLDKKKQKKRAIPIWWSLGGAAAALVLLLMVINPFAEQPVEEQIITDTENSAVREASNKLEERDNQDVNDSEISSKIQEEGLANTSNEENTKATDHQTTGNNLSSKNASTVAENAASSSNRDGSSTEMAQVESNRSNNSQTLSSANENAVSNNAVVVNPDETTPAQNQSIISSKMNDDQVAEHTDEKDDVEKQSIYDAIEEQNELEEAIADNKSGKWSVGPSVAPVYFDASGDGSPIGADFSSNSKSGKLNLSYGLTVAYEAGKKVKIRSGVHRVNYGYSTNGVLFSPTLRAAATDKLANIDYSPNSESIVVQSKESPKNQAAFNSKEIALSDAPTLDGKMVQQLGYIEVPLEVNYAVLDKKFGVDLIGGLSSLFLVDNSVLLESNQLVTEMGEANNINSLNFSANFGMGLNYQFSPKIRFNVEPVFKYQLNTFSNVSGNFRPYSIGVYSGFSFKF
ncbi:outer membrane beta-barrel protein [Flagellimonas oceanensis]|uniref:outer membrane beta-barrel protein n=1 Tax=Flagellimonas oceanensis TaxID=2499163 RepID=UPI003BAA95B3